MRLTLPQRMWNPGAPQKGRSTAVKGPAFEVEGQVQGCVDGSSEGHRIESGRGSGQFVDAGSKGSVLGCHRCGESPESTCVVLVSVLGCLVVLGVQSQCVGQCLNEFDPWLIEGLVGGDDGVDRRGQGRVSPD